ncbi:uncharacterized protein LOC131313991 [Rhododendron vialii]|uniref:uncharacterized protein LOC131313991 n=1 Tax=Rhododendron vialii TaxID=182163 RepID=UPI00265E8FA6|nr:uncharacterized protein LOC131313991 [Rhododendron vialii]
MHLVKWDLISRSKEDGGLGVKKMMQQNLALLAKWWWRFHEDKDSLGECYKRKIQIGSWNLATTTTGNRRTLRPREEDERKELIQSLQNVSLDPSRPDYLYWKWKDSRRFSVKSAYDQWERQCFSRDPVLGSVWRSLSPPKVEIFSWLAIQSRVATRSMLHNRNLILDPRLVRCPFSSKQDETPQHLFLFCNVTWSVWSIITEWWHTNWVCPSSLADLAVWWFDNGFCNLEKHIWEACFFATIWSLWLARNKLVLNNVEPVIREVGDIIKTKVAM